MTRIPWMLAVSLLLPSALALSAPLPDYTAIDDLCRVVAPEEWMGPNASEPGVAFGACLEEWSNLPVSTGAPNERQESFCRKYQSRERVPDETHAWRQKCQALVASVNARARDAGKAKAKANADAAKVRAEWAARPKGVTIGMTAGQVLATQWGKPRSVNKTTTAYGTREQWVYGDGNYLYFENGLLTAIQN